MTIEAHGGWPAILGALSNGVDIGSAAAEAVLDSILAGEATDAQLAAFLVSLHQKGATTDELAGLVRAMLAAAVPLSVPADTIDLVGAGGSLLGREAALNVSTMASFVAAAAGATVCKHGNRRASSTSGSFDVLEALGVHVDADVETVQRCVAEVGLGFAYARTFHPAMRFAGPVRAELGIPTVFNLLGPLSHPGRLQRQVIGVTNEAVAAQVASVLAVTGSVHAMVVTGHGGLDELSTTGDNAVWTVRSGEVERGSVSPKDVGLPVAAVDQIRGGDAAANALIARRVFDAEAGPLRDIVVFNAGAGLVVAGVATDIVDGVERAVAAIDAGAVVDKLEALTALCGAEAPG